MSTTQVELRSRIEKLDDPLLTKALNDHAVLVEQAEQQAAQYVKKFKDQVTVIEQAVELCKTFKRIDISFLQMAKGGKPVFAFMPYDLYRKGGTVWWNRLGYRCGHPSETPIFGELFLGAAYTDLKMEYNPGDPSIRQNSMKEFAAAMQKNTWDNGRTALLEHTALRKVPETVEAFVEQNRKQFDKTWIAEEASWQPAPKDPLVIGQRGAFFFLLCAWDATILESYVRAEFSEQEEGISPA